MKIPPLRKRPAILVGLTAFALMLAIGNLPLFGGPGYENSLAAGALLPSLAAIAAAFSVARGKHQPIDSLFRGAGIGLSFALLGYAAALLHGMRNGFCDALSGTIFYALGPGFGCLLGGVWGAVAAEIAGRPRSKRAALALLLLATLAPVLGIVTSLLRFYTSPIIFAFDPFFGFFSGAIYDTVVSDATFQLFTYRLGSLATLLALFILGAHLVRNSDGRLRLRSIGHSGLVLVGILAAIVSFTITLEGPRLGHWQTASTITRELGGELRGERCEIIYARSLGEERARLFARDCDAHVEAVESFLGVSDTETIRAYLFRDPSQKRRLMGAARTYIAKPWRHEVYLQDAGFPHPVLGHEIAHIIAGTFTKGPFRIGGRYLGLLSNPGLVEGIAVAASPDENDDLTPAEWSRAMLDLGILPSLDRVFAFGFFGESAAKSYTVAGAFVDYIHDRFGKEALRSWYAGAPIEEVAKKSLGELESDWHRDLATIEISPNARHIAEARFDRPSVFGRLCPHEVDELRSIAHVAESAGDWAEAKLVYDKLLRLDPRHIGARFQLARCHQRLGQSEGAIEMLGGLAEDHAFPRAIRDKSLEMLADLYLQAGEIEEAEPIYRELWSRTASEDGRRNLEVKLEAVRNPSAREAIVAYLLGSPEYGTDPLDAAAKLGALSANETEDGLADYLLARGRMGRGRHEEGAKLLDRALAKGLALSSVRREALRLRIILACALEDRAAMMAAYENWRGEGGTEGARGEGTRRLVERCGGR